MRTTMSFLLTVLLLNSCAWVEVKRISPNDTESKGFRYYDAKPLLVVTDTNTQVIFVPNYSRPYAVQFGAFLAKHDVKLTIKDGVFFSEIDSSQDPAELIKGLVALGQEAVKAAGSAKAASEPVGGKAVAVYEFIFDDKGDVKDMKKLLIN